MGATTTRWAAEAAQPQRWGRRRIELTPEGVTVAIVAVLGFSIAHASASPWTGLLSGGLLAALVVDLTWSLLALGSPRIRVTTPTEAVVGQAHPCGVHLDRTRGRIRVRMAATRSEPPSAVVEAPGSVRLPVVPERRGVFPRAQFGLALRGPLGLIGTMRDVVVELDAPVEVGPAPVPFDEAPLAALARSDEGAAERGPVRSGLAAGLRDHQPGDGIRLVHWPASARLGRLVVRELDRPLDAHARVVVDLGPTPGAAAERTAGRAVTLVERLRAGGAVVVLTTREESGWVTREVGGGRDLTRRLARAVCGPEWDRADDAVVLTPAGVRAGAPR